MVANFWRLIYTGYLQLPAAAFRSGSGRFRHCKIQGITVKIVGFFNFTYYSCSQPSIPKNCISKFWYVVGQKNLHKIFFFEKFKTSLFFVCLKSCSHYISDFFQENWKNKYAFKNSEHENPIDKKALNSIQNELNYKSVKVGTSSGSLAKFTTLRVCNLA